MLRCIRNSNEEKHTES